jgi:transposase
MMFPGVERLAVPSQLKYLPITRHHFRLKSPPERSSRRIQNAVAVSSFSTFMNGITAAFPNRKLRVVLDNLNTHKKNEHRLKAHPNVQFHFTPTNASWLNQVEIWFSILLGQSLSGASFTSLKQLEQHIDAYIKAYNDKAEPFVWTKKKVRQRRFKGGRIDQL